MKNQILNILRTSLTVAIISTLIVGITGVDAFSGMPLPPRPPLGQQQPRPPLEQPKPLPPIDGQINERQRLIKEMRDKKMEENKKFNEQRRLQKQNDIEKLKNEFEAKKQSILAKARTGKISMEDAKNQIIVQRDTMTEYIKTNFKKEDDKIFKQKIDTLKSAIRKDFGLKLAYMKNLPKNQQKNILDKMVAKLFELAKSSTKEKSDQYMLINEVLLEMKKSLE